MAEASQLPRVWPVADGHRTAERRSLAMHTLIAARLDEATVDQARGRVDAWVRDGGPVARHWADAWRELLARDLPDVAAAIARDDPTMTQLRQTTPFAGVLTSAERSRVLLEVR